MPIVPFGEWMPDSADVANRGSVIATNVLPGVDSYKPMPSLEVITSALTARPTGAIEARDHDANVYQYAGDVDTIYSLSTTTWNDVSLGGGYSSGSEERWEFVKWRNKVLATNWNDNPQQITMGGAAFSNLTTTLKARHIAVVRDFVVFGNTFDATDGNEPERVRWSAINDETDYTVSATTLSDFRDLNKGGHIQKIEGGEYGVIVSEHSTWRMTFVGSPTVFQIDEVLPGVGAIAPGGVVRLGDVVYIMSESGFVALENGITPISIGAGKVDKYFLADLDVNNVHRISSVADPEAGRIMWSYPGAGNTNGLPNKIICYDRTFNKWSIIEQDAELIWRSSGIGRTLDNLDTISSSIDDLAISLDSSQWKGGYPELAAFDSSFKHGFFSGAPMTATLETREAELNEGARTHLNAFRPMVDGATDVTGKVGSRNRQSDSVSYTSSLNQSASGRFTTRKNARFHRFQLEITDDDWTDAIGVEVDRKDARRADGRG
jgi:hypothetical protein